MVSSIATDQVTVLRNGDRGPEVIDLQYLLLVANQISPSIVGSADGVFGRKTEAAVLMIQQRSEGLQKDGIVGSKTWNAISPAHRWPMQTAGVFMRKGDRGAETLQKGLRAKGFYSGAIDGDFGPMTHAAVVSFQKMKRNTNLDGVVGPYTFESAVRSLALARDGLQFINAQTGQITRFPFGLNVDFVQGTLSRYFLSTPSVSRNEECPSGPLKIASWPNGFSVNADESNKFVGWSVRQGTDSERYATVDGIGLGSSRRELEQQAMVEIVESSLGTEFRSGQLAGTLSSDREDATIDNMWAGTNCIFR